MKNLAVEGPPRLLFIDSGLGGLTVLRAVRQAAPEAEIYFIADDAGFPYGTRDEGELVARLLAIVGTGISAYSPDCIVLACNTASTVALSALRQSCDIPIVGTVPAIKPAAQLTESGLVSVLATPGTVNREYTHTLIAEFGGAAKFHLVGAPRLAALAEAYASGATVEDDDILREIEPCFVQNGSTRTDVIVLGCTHYPLLLERLDALAPWPVTWLDPAPAIARRVANVLADRGHVVGVGAKSGRGVIAFTSGQPATTALQSLLQACNLTPVDLLPSPPPLDEISMIPRYSRPQMAAIWSDQTKYEIWLEIETLAAEAMEQFGQIPSGVSRALRERGAFDIARIDEIEREVKHDVIAFLTSVAEHAGPEARYMHQGMTSSDVLDTCLAVQLTRATDILLADLDALLAALKRRAIEHKYTVTVGRSHGIHAEPVTFGLKLAFAYAEFSRAKERLLSARKDVGTCAISGAVGTFAHLDPRVELYVAEKLGLSPEPVSTQIIPRDRHAMFFATLGVIASSVERLATEIRHLQRTEVAEAEEFFSEGQKGSSAMPHKRNPVLTENLTGLARLVRGYVVPAMENVALWHERDISHSSVERMIAPDATVTLDFALSRLAGVIEKLVVYPDRMRANLERGGGLVHSQQVLLALTQKGFSREDAYKAVQRNAMRAFRGEGSFLAFLKDDPDVKAALSENELAALFDMNQHVRHVDTIFERVFQDSGPKQ